MSLRFDGSQGLIVVPVRIVGPTGEVTAQLALDTGATGTLLNWDLFVLVGADPGAVADRVHVTTGSGVEFAPRVSLIEVAALGVVRRDFPVLAHTLPPSATVDGVLGLDFLRGRKLTVDFRSGRLDLQ